MRAGPPDALTRDQAAGDPPGLINPPSSPRIMFDWIMLDAE